MDNIYLPGGEEFAERRKSCKCECADTEFVLICKCNYSIQRRIVYDNDSYTVSPVSPYPLTKLAGVRGNLL